jgi:glutamate dehydrogenase/leucine dehydrogenase
VSGAGNVAQYAAKKLIELGAVVHTLSDSTGYLYEPNGFTMEQIEQIMDIKTRQRTSLAAYRSPTGKRWCESMSSRGYNQLFFRKCGYTSRKY